MTIDHTTTLKCTAFAYLADVPRGVGGLLECPVCGCGHVHISERREPTRSDSTGLACYCEECHTNLELLAQEGDGNTCLRWHVTGTNVVPKTGEGR